MRVVHRPDDETPAAAPDDRRAIERARQRARERLDLISSVALVVAFFVSIGLGYWGWLRVPHDFAGTGHFLNRAYLTLQLFVLHPQELPKHFPWQLQVARFSAPGVLVIVTVTVVVTTLSRLIHGRSMRFLSGHVIICGAGVHGAQLAKNLVRARNDTPPWRPGRARRARKVVVIDIDEGAPGMQGAPRAGERRLIADTVQADTLKTARVHKAAQLIAVTGDDVVNCQIASAALRLGGNPALHVLVEAEPSFARFLEDWDTDDDEEQDAALADEPVAARPSAAQQANVVVFGVNAIAADTLLDDLDERLFGSEPNPPRRRHLLLAGDHPLLEAIVVSALRRRRAYLLRELDQAPEILQISVLGPQAEDLVATITKRWRPEPTLLTLDATELDPCDEDSILASRWRTEWRLASTAIVACEKELDSIALATALSHALGGEVWLTRVRTQPGSELDRQLEQRTGHRNDLATITVRAITELAWSVDERQIEAITPRGRLSAALQDDPRYEGQGSKMADAVLEAQWLGLHYDAAPRFTPSTYVLAQSLLNAAKSGDADAPSVPPSALVGAGLTIKLESRANLWRAAAQLSSEGRSQEAFLAWCEFARKLSSDRRSELWLRKLARVPGAAGTMLKLRGATLDADAQLEGLSPQPDVRRRIGAPDCGQVAIFAGGAASMSSETETEVAELLQRALEGYEGVILTGGTDVGLCGVVHAAAEARGVEVVGYAPAGSGVSSMWLRETHDNSENSEWEPLAMWTDILCAGFSAKEVRLVAFPGGSITIAEIVLARALGAKAAWIDPRKESGSLEDMLTFGAGGVLELPADAMTLRAFLGWPEPEHKLDGHLRETVARHLHERYRDEHRRLHSQEDPALAPWELLAPILRRSNCAAVDDIPNKLRVVGKRLAEDGARLHLTLDQIELLAEMEHGRFNYERLSAGWQLGWRREVSSSLSPYLEPWSELEDAVKEWDRDAVRTIGDALQQAGWGVADA
jgi:hypothetical protein